jgi:thiol:disulfide interchange protein DsbD
MDAQYHSRPDMASRANLWCYAAMKAALLLCLALLAAAPARAAESNIATSPRVTARLVSEQDAVAPGGTLRVGLQLRVAPGWHTYWRNPGDAGVPTAMDFSLPQGAKAGPIAWPAPSRETEGDLTIFGYTGTVLLPVAITAPTTAGPLPIRVHASWLVCSNICVPEQADFSLNLAVGAPAPSTEAGLFAQADAAMPRPSPWKTEIASDGVLRVTGAGITPAAVRAAWFVPDAGDSIAPGGPQNLSVGDGSFTLTLTRGPGFRPGTLLRGVLTLQDGGGDRTALAISAAPGAAVAGTPLWELLGFAFLGGLILNLMPCVFPVLAIKAAGLARLSGAARGHARGQALAYAAGVVVTFLALGSALVAARAAGLAVGWGTQFQQPAFVAAMAWLLFAVGLNMSGVFEIGGGMEGAGQELAAKPGHAGSFFTGLLAVLVATPCTAPFMGAAIAAALAAPPATMLAIFLAMGIGLAAPYLVLAGLPGLARALPRPGAWMDVLKQALAFPMYAASAWLVWVASLQSGPSGVLAVGAGLLLIGFAGWAIGLAQHREGVGRRVAQGIAALAGLGAAAILVLTVTMPAASAAVAAQPGVEAFSPARLSALRAAGKPVFVDMTAAWCVTCLVNERLALDTAATRSAFAAHGVTYLKGDWTRQDPTISAYLRAHGRDGVPLYVFYPRGGAHGEVLPQILTEATIIGRVNSAGS